MSWDGNRNLLELMRSSARPGRGARRHRPGALGHEGEALADALPENSTIAEEVWHRYKSFRSLRSDLAGVSTRGFNGLNESQPTRVKARPRLVPGRPSVVHSIANGSSGNSQRSRGPPGGRCKDRTRDRTPLEGCALPLS